MSRTRIRGMWAGDGFCIPAGSLDRTFAYLTPANTAAARRDIVLISDSTGFGSGGNYSWLQRLRDDLNGAGLTDGGKGIFAGGESGIGYDAPEINGFVSSTFGGGFPDGFDNLSGQYYYDTGSPANHTLTLQFKGTAFRLWYSQRSNVGEFTYAVDGGSAVTVDAAGVSTNKFVYVSGLADTTHTVVITNRGGRTAVPPASVTPSVGGTFQSNPLAAGTYYYKASYVFGGGETLPTSAASIVVDAAGRNVTLAVPKVGQDSIRIYRATSSGGPFELRAVVDTGGSSSTELFRDDAACTTSVGVIPATSGTTNLNTSSQACYIAFAPLRAAGVALQKQATSGATMGQFMGGGPPVWTAFGLTYNGGSLTDPASYAVDTGPVSAARIKPVLGILDLGFNDLTGLASADYTVLTAGVGMFAAMCAAASCDGLVLSGQLPYNANWTTYGAGAFSALKTAALSLGLAFGDLFLPVGGPSLNYTGGATNPHLSKVQYQAQGDWVFANFLSQQIPPLAPTNTTAPAASLAASAASVTTGTWASFPAALTYTYQWKRDGVAIAGATASAYTLQSADAGAALTCVVTATGTAGSASATSNTLSPVAPVNTVAPAITGAGTTGDTETCSTGTWTATPVATYSYQWKRNGTNIAGATSSTYALVVADVGTALTCVVTAANGAGTTTATSNTVTPTAGFTPASLAGLIAWHQADTITGKSDGDPVSSWADASASANPLLQATGGSQPLYKTNIQNGLPALLFDGVDDLMAAANNISLRHIFVVAKYTAATFASYAGLVTGVGGGGTELVLIGVNGGTIWYYDGSSGYTTYFKNGTSQSLAGSAAGGPMNAWAAMDVSGAAVSLKLQAGRDRTNAGRNWKGYIAEIVAYDTVLSTSDRQAVELYLKNKWGTP